MSQLPTVGELKKLPLRAIVAYAVRAAARVQTYDQVTHPLFDAADALRRAREFCVTGQWDSEVVIYGKKPPDVPRNIASALAASDAAVKALTGEPNNCAAYACDAAQAGRASVLELSSTASVVDQFDYECQRDFSNLLTRRLGVFPQVGRPIDPDETGPLGPLWVERPILGLRLGFDFGEVSWSPSEERSNTSQHQYPSSQVSVYFDVESKITKREMLLFLEYLSEAYRDIGGNGLEVVDGNSYSLALQPEAVS